MPLSVSVTGAAEARHVAVLLRARHKTMQRDIVKGANKATRPLERRIREEVKRMPGGYQAVLAASLKVTTSVRQAGIKIIVKAQGTTEQRDVSARDAGSLRHPVFGRTKILKSGKPRANPWAHQRIRPGFVSDPARELGPDVRREIDRVLDEARRAVEKG